MLGVSLAQAEFTRLQKVVLLGALSKQSQASPPNQPALGGSEVARLINKQSALSDWWQQVMKEVAMEVRISWGN